MVKKLSIWAIAILSVVLLAVLFNSQGAAGFGQQNTSGESVKDLQSRITRLEGQVAALQAQVKELTNKSSSRISTLPGMQKFPGNKIPLGATQHEINGLNYWVIPLDEGQ